MAESPSKKNKEVANNPKDDLDEMFDKVDSNIPSQVFEDDEEDAIDRLLMGHAPDSQAKSSPSPLSNFSDDDFDIDTLLMSAEKETAKSSINANSKAEMKQSIDSLLDEFSDDSENIAPPPAKQVEPKTDDNADSFDEFANFDEDLITPQPPKVEGKSLVQSADEQDDFDIFDIFEEDFSVAKPVEIPVAKANKSSPEIAEPVSIETPESTLADESTSTSETNVEKDFDEFDMSFDDAFGEVSGASQTATSSISEPVIEKASDTTELDEFDMSFDDAFGEVSAASQAATSSISEPVVEKSSNMTELDEFDMSFDDAFAEVSGASQTATSSVSVPVVEKASDMTDLDEFDMSFDDAFAEVSGASQTVASSVNESVTQTNSAPQDQVSEEDNFLIADFDITSDLDDFTTDTNNFASETIDVGMVHDSHVDEDRDELQDAFSELDDFLEQETQTNESSFDTAIQDNVSATASAFQGIDNTTQKELLSQIGELWAAQDLLKQQFTASATASGLPEKVMTELDMLANEQKSLRRLMEQNNPKKSPVLVYVALALGGLGILVGAGLFALQMSRNTEYEALKQHSESLEKEIEILKNGGLTAQGVDVNTALADMNAQMTEIKEKFTGLDKLAQIDELQASVAGLQVDLNGLLKKEVEQQALAKPTEPIPTQKHIENQTTNQLQIKDVGHSPTQAKEPEKVAEKPATAPEAKVVASVVKKPKVKPIMPVPSVAQEPRQPGRWAANLVSFRQDWYAKRKAEEFAQRGIMVDVVPVELKGETWYRLRAGGFSDRAEANSFAAKAKKQLNLTSVWVTLE